jgi:PadR family transcriptional regulator PadR
MPEPKLDLLQGTLDLLVLQTLSTMGPLHGYGLARRIEQTSGHALLLNQGTIYASLVRLQHRRAKFYALTAAGRKALADQASAWERLSEVIARVMTARAGEAGS